MSHLQEEDESFPAVLLGHLLETRIGLLQEVHSRPEIVSVSRDGGKQYEPWIVGREPVIRTYSTSDEPHLFLRFARSWPSRKQILSFVRQYGIPVFDEEEESIAAVSVPTDVARGVPLMSYRSHAQLVDLIARVYRALEDKDSDQLVANREAIVRLNADFREFLRDPGKGLTVGMGSDQEVEKGREDLERAAANLVSRVCTAFCGVVKGAGMHLFVSYSPGEWMQRVTISASFMEIVMEQFIDYARSRKRVGLCQDCGAVFPKTRKDRVFCDNTCSARWRNRRKRKRDAQRSQG